jgi:rSAM/selenodomain-associated transferase 2
MSLAVVIPVLNEERELPLLLEDLRCLQRVTRLDIIVVDAGSEDDTIASALAGGARVLDAPRGRARQLNAGAGASSGDWLLFLHADSRLDAEAQQVLASALREPAPFQAAVFRYAVDLSPIWKHMLELGQALRETLWGLPYGDQGLLIRRECFASIGGYPDLPVLEDVAMIRALRRRVKIERLPATIVTSGRRYRQHGVIRTSLQHLALISLYLLDVSPSRLARGRS